MKNDKNDSRYEPHHSRSEPQDPSTAGLRFLLSFVTCLYKGTVILQSMKICIQINNPFSPFFTLQLNYAESCLGGPDVSRGHPIANVVAIVMATPKPGQTKPDLA